MGIPDVLGVHVRVGLLAVPEAHRRFIDVMEPPPEVAVPPKGCIDFARVRTCVFAVVISADGVLGRVDRVVDTVNAEFGELRCCVGISSVPLPLRTIDPG